MINLSDVKITRQRRRSMALYILPGGAVEARVPKLMPKFFINEFIKKNSDWIEKKLKTTGKITKRKYQHGETFLFLGKEYLLDVGNYSKIEIKDDKLLFPIGMLFRAKKELENWYIKQAKEVIGDQVNSYAKEMNTSFNALSFSDTSSKWGSCTHDNRLQFNWRLIMAPFLVLRYVVIHELVHTTEKNHSRKFWTKVANFNPSYKEQIKWLKRNGDSLTV
ncbi:MAG TPA: SprT family zinc-dependent metalloprotease [Patescibacteria group bacterium]|nr:SprT family zinc-dependent metalloprotease [Patescibacteria group bacterium]